MKIEDFNDIKYEKFDNGIVQVTLDQVERKNALSNVSFLELWWAMEIFDADDSTGAMLITGAEDPNQSNLQEHAFSSGGYFHPKAMANLSPELAKQIDMQDIAQAKLTLRMAKVTKPIVAALNGYAIGGAFTMLLSGADLIYIADSAYIKMPFVSIAIVPEFASTYLLPRMIGMQKAKEIFYFGKEIKPDEALALGLVNGVCAHDELLAHSNELALKLVPPQGAGMAIKETKRALNTPLIEYYENALKLENEGLLKTATSQDFIEGMMSRKEKRPPAYKGA